jgi:hypothetical protein
LRLGIKRKASEEGPIEPEEEKKDNKVKEAEVFEPN